MRGCCRQVIAATAVAVALACGSASAAAGPPDDAQGSTLAVIGDTPYDDAQEAAFPSLVADIDADHAVDAVVHLGDIKSGQPCTDEFFASRRTLYESFDEPFVLTPGDNDWTDCHRPQFGLFLPTERLESLRSLFYPNPHVVRGEQHAMGVKPQSDDPEYGEFVENVIWSRSRVVLSTLHVVGSNNNLFPWFTRDPATETAEHRALRLAEFDRRLAADLAWLNRIFAVANERKAAGVVIAMQANLFVSLLFPGEDVSGFSAIVQRIADLANQFARPVLLLQGDTHEYHADSAGYRASAYGDTDRRRRVDAARPEADCVGLDALWASGETYGDGDRCRRAYRPGS